MAFIEDDDVIQQIPLKSKAILKYIPKSDVPVGRMRGTVDLPLSNIPSQHFGVCPAMQCDFAWGAYCSLPSIGAALHEFIFPRATSFGRGTSIRICSL